LLLLIGLVPGVCGVAAAQAVPREDRRGAQANECLSRSSHDPRAALVLSDSLLASGPMPLDVEARVLACRTQALQVTGQGEAALQSVEHLLALADRADAAPPLRMKARLHAIGVLLGMGESARAMTLMESVLAESRARGEATSTVDALLAVASVHALQLNDQEGALKYFDEALSMLTRLRPRATPQEMTLHYNRAYSLLLLGRHDAAEAGFVAALRMADALDGAPVMRQRIAGHRAEILRLRGDAAAARVQFEQVASAQEQLDDALGRTVTLRRLALIELDAGHADAALAHAQQALDLAVQGRFAPEIRNGVDLLVTLHAALGHADAAERYRSMARDLAPGTDQAAALEQLARLRAEVDAELAAGRHASYQRLGQTRLQRDLALAALAALLLLCAALLAYMRRRRRRLRAADAST